MYMILLWKNADPSPTCIHNEDGSIKLFNSVFEADEYANGKIDSDSMRVVSIEGVSE